uniref:Peptidase M1 membrane alanine aminopeptidase domain-containing protein n=1 Tax=Plectus sambesii TaxID=2011161 RepID=A0A914VBE3_9BILA
MDFIAAPSFPVGGMENWGIVVFHHNMLLDSSEYHEDAVDESEVTVEMVLEHYKISKIITHEIAHQWFGNLVSIGDWSELWLNEGFATYYVYEFLSKLQPELTDNEYY